MQVVVRKLRLFAAACALAVAGLLAYSAVSPRRAAAQSVTPSTLLTKTAGPIQLASGEQALIGLLLPAVQNTLRPFRLNLINEAGATFASIPLPPPATIAASGPYTAFYDVFFADGSVRVVNHATGAVVFSGDLADGMIIIVCLPAVQSTGIPVPATAGSVQMITDGTRGQIVGMCDGS